MGEIFAGRYELVDPLGEGGTGVVWRAWDHRDDRYVAAKVMRQVDAASLLRFVREQAVRIDHPHVLTPLGWAGDDDRVLLTMPVARGGSAATLVGDHGPLPPAWAATLLDQLLAALGSIHAQGLVHRDVKPANLLLDATGRGMPRARLADFGIAAAVDQPRLTHVSHSVGTVGYAAPETLQPGWDPDPRADLYGAGLTAFELLTAQRPSAGTDVAADLVTAGVPVELARVVLELAASDPHDRPASATEARDRLAATGLVARSVEGLGDHSVEVFDQLPPLPDGWDDDGPTSARPDGLVDGAGRSLESVAAGPAQGTVGREDPSVIDAAATRTDLGPPTQVAPGRGPAPGTGTTAATEPDPGAEHEVEPRPEPEVEPPASTGTEQARPLSRTGLALVVIGVLMIAVAVLLAL